MTPAHLQLIHKLLAGTYNVLVSDLNGCTKTGLAIINDIGGGTAVISDSSSVLCNGGNNGDATVAMTGGGTVPFTYSWNTTPAQSNVQATGLNAGIYSVTITDAVGCVTSASVNITQPAALTMAVTGTTNASCFGACDGEAVISAAGGTGGYTYSWSPSGGTSSTGIGLCAGITYTCLLEDANGCSLAQTTSVAEPNELLLVATPVDASCNGGADGNDGSIPSLL